MLYGVHVFARAKVIPDLALSRGEEADRARPRDRRPRARVPGRRRHGDGVPGPRRGRRRRRPWLDRAAGLASEHPTPLRARRLETWRGMAAAARGRRRRDARRTWSGRCSSPPTSAWPRPVRGARPPRAGGLAAGRRARRRRAPRRWPSGRRTRRPSWRPRCPAIRRGGGGRRRRSRRIALARGRHGRGRRARPLRDRGAAACARDEDAHLDVAAAGRGDRARRSARSGRSSARYLQQTLAMIAQRTVDEDVRVRWFRSPIGRELTRLVGPSRPAARRATASSRRAWTAALLKSLIAGQDERRDRRGARHRRGGRRRASSRELYAQIGASSRAEATAFAFREGVL